MMRLPDDGDTDALTGISALHAFIDRFLAAPTDTDIELRVGHTADGELHVIINMLGLSYAFTLKDAEKIADACESAMYKFNDQNFANIILGLRQAVSVARKLP